MSYFVGDSNTVDQMIQLAVKQQLTCVVKRTSGKGST